MIFRLSKKVELKIEHMPSTDLQKILYTSQSSLPIRLPIAAEVEETKKQYRVVIISESSLASILQDGRRKSGFDLTSLYNLCSTLPQQDRESLRCMWIPNDIPSRNTFFLSKRHSILVVAQPSVPREYAAKDELVYTLLDTHYMALMKTFTSSILFASPNQTIEPPKLIKMGTPIPLKDLLNKIDFKMEMILQNPQHLMPKAYIAFRLLLPDLTQTLNYDKARYIEGITNLISIRFKGATYTFGPYRVVIDTLLSPEQYTLKSQDCFTEKVTVSPLPVSMAPPHTDLCLPDPWSYLIHSSDRQARFHPHISSSFIKESKSYTCCLGNYVPLIQEAYMKGDAHEIFQLMYVYLSSLTSNWYSDMANFRVSTDQDFLEDILLHDSPRNFPLENGSYPVHDHKPTPHLLDYYCEIYNYPQPTPSSPHPYFPKSSTPYITPYHAHEFDEDGYDPEGFDDEGLDRNRRTRDGLDANGYDINGFNRQGFNRAGYDRDGYNTDGYDRYGFNRNGYDRDGYNSEGLDAMGNISPIARARNEEFFDDEETSPSTTSTVAQERIVERLCDTVDNMRYSSTEVPEALIDGIMSYLTVPSDLLEETMRIFVHECCMSIRGFHVGEELRSDFYTNVFEAISSTPFPNTSSRSFTRQDVLQAIHRHFRQDPTYILCEEDMPQSFLLDAMVSNRYFDSVSMMASMSHVGLDNPLLFGYWRYVFHTILINLDTYDEIVVSELTLHEEIRTIIHYKLVEMIDVLNAISGRSYSLTEKELAATFLIHALGIISSVSGEYEEGEDGEEE